MVDYSRFLLRLGVFERKKLALLAAFALDVAYLEGLALEVLAVAEFNRIWFG